MPAVNVSFRINGAIIRRTATNSRFDWKLPKKENITIRIPRKKLSNPAPPKRSDPSPSRREPSPSRKHRERSPSRKHHSPSRAHRAVEEDDVISEADMGSDDDNSDLSDLASDDSAGQMHPGGSKRRRKDRILMTARQRSLVEGEPMASLMSIQDRKKPDKTLTEEQVTKKRLQAKKRKIQQEKVAEKTKQDTIDKILNAKGEKYKREEKLKSSQAALRNRSAGMDEPHVRWQSTATERVDSSSISFSAQCKFIPPLFKTLFVK